MKIKNFLRYGKLWGYPQYDSEVLTQMGTIMNSNNIFASKVFGNIVFEGVDGKFYRAVLEGSLEEISEADINNILGYETEESDGEQAEDQRKV